MARRKEFKKAEYTVLPNCFGREAKDKKGEWARAFGNTNPIILELGCGTADLSYALAQKYPKINYVGIDIKPVRLWKPAKKALAEETSNMLFLYIHLLAINDYFAEDEVEEIWITFPDPFLKKRYAKHRMINPPFLQQYRKILKKGGKIHFKTDNLVLFQYALEVFVREGNIRFHALSFDLHEDTLLSEEVKTETEYERKYRAEGIPINYVCFSFMD